MCGGVCGWVGKWARCGALWKRRRDAPVMLPRPGADFLLSSMQARSSRRRPNAKSPAQSTRRPYGGHRRAAPQCPVTDFGVDGGSENTAKAERARWQRRRAEGGFYRSRPLHFAAPPAPTSGINGCPRSPLTPPARAAGRGLGVVKGCDEGGCRSNGHSPWLGSDQGPTNDEVDDTVTSPASGRHVRSEPLW